MIKKGIRKELKESLEIIDRIKYNNRYELNIKSLNLFKVPVELSIEKSGIYVKNTSPIYPNKSLNFSIAKDLEVELIDGDYCLKSENAHLITIQDFITDVGILIKFSLSGLSQNLRVEKEYYFRSIIEVNKDVRFYHIFQTQLYSVNNGSYDDLIKIAFDDSEYHIFLYSNNDKHYFIIDSFTKQKFEHFSYISYCIHMAYSFITGKLCQDECYYLFYDKPKHDKPLGFNFKRIRPSKNNSHLQLITSNPYNLIITQEEIKKFLNKLNLLNSKDFSQLCSLIYNNKQVLGTITLLIESPGYPLETMTACYSVALETISTYFNEKNEDRMNPIKNKKLIKSIVDEFKNIIKEKAEQNKGEDFTIIYKNIDKLNSPTNQDKLEKPFTLNNIILNESELETLKLRNDFLHGRFVNVYKEFSETNKINKLFYVCVTLHFMIARLILKLIGYKGYIINFPKNLYERSHNIILPGEYFIKNDKISQ
jgi:hypothetical protein